MSRYLHRIVLVLALFTVTLACTPDPWPYDEAADAHVALAQATQRARSHNKHLMLIFGANWCKDCRVLDDAMQDPMIEALLQERYELVKIDVGNWDKHLDINQQWGDPIRGGIPALVIGSVEGQVLYTTEGGDLATARESSFEDFYLYFAHLAEGI